MKSAFADNRVLLDVVAYQIDWEDIQVASLVNGVSGLVNGGEATSHGLEVSRELPSDRRPDARPQRGLQRREHRRGLPADHRARPATGADIVHQHRPEGRSHALRARPDLVGHGRLLPAAHGRLGHERRRRLPLRRRPHRRRRRSARSIAVGGAGGRHRRSRAGLDIDSYQALDLYLSVSNEHWSIRGYMKNAFDERAYSTMADVTSPVTGRHAPHVGDADPCRARSASRSTTASDPHDLANLVNDRRDDDRCAAPAVPVVPWRYHRAGLCEDGVRVARLGARTLHRRVLVPGATVTTGLPFLTPAQAHAAGAQAMVIGVANAGGFIPPAWLDALVEAMEAGLDLDRRHACAPSRFPATARNRRATRAAPDRHPHSARAHSGRDGQGAHRPPTADHRHRLRTRQEIHRALARACVPVRGASMRRSARRDRPAS